MKNKTVKDLMIPIDDYATVDEDATLKEAVTALENVHERLSKLRYKHRAVLVLDKRKKVVGKVSMHDVIVALEPAYRMMGDYRLLQQSGLTREFIDSLRESYSMWQHPLDHICENAAKRPVREIMYTPTEGEHVEEDALLDEAIHQLVVGSHQSLLVTKNGQVVGVLRVTDVFQAVSDALKEC